MAQAYALALQLFESGAIAEAEQACRLMLQAEPAQPEVILLLGICCWQRGDAVSAVEAYDLASALRPGFGEALFNKALALRALGRPEEALNCYRLAGEACPGWADVPFNMGNLLFDLGRISQALECYDRAVTLNPLFSQAQCNRGNCLGAMGRVDEARAAYERMANLAPNSADPYFNLGELYQTHRRFDEALQAYDRALALQPNHAKTLNNRSLVLLALDRPAEALASVELALALCPDDPKAQNNRGVVLRALDRLEDAEACYDIALSLYPDYPDALYNRGQVRHELLRLDEALSDYDGALRLRPVYPDCSWNRALCLLLQGKLEAGWGGYESRWHLGQSPAEPLMMDGRPSLSPSTDVSGRTVLLWSEQGLGDTLQFARYGLVLAGRGARVVLEVQASLVPLLNELPGIELVIARGDARPDFDFHCPLLSLPWCLGTRLDTIPHPGSYLSAPMAKRDVWREKVADITGVRVGIAWSGSPTNKGDRQRSIPLANLGELWEVEGLTWFSLQPDIRDSDRAAAAASPLHDFGAELRDFADTAALIAELDLVIAVDTSVAHLAGALGKPVWLMLPHFPDWRWLLQRDDSPWYSSMRLFRQTRRNDWTSVIAGVRAALAALASGRPS